MALMEIQYASERYQEKERERVMGRGRLRERVGAGWRVWTVQTASKLQLATEARKCRAATTTAAAAAQAHIAHCNVTSVLGHAACA